MKTLSGTRIGSGQHAPATAANTMHALVYHGPGNRAWRRSRGRLWWMLATPSCG